MAGNEPLEAPLHPAIVALGAGTSRARARVAASPISLSAIRNWSNAIGLRDPRYGGTGRDPAARPIAPPPMLQTWAGQGLAQIADQGSRALHHDVRHAFREAGFTSVVATNYAQNYLADLNVDDVVEETSWVEDVSPLKATRLGQGHFVRIAFEFRNRKTGARVGFLTATTFYFRPLSSVEPARDVGGSAPHELPGNHPVEFDLTPTLIVAGALASNDFEPVHHDLDAARADGLCNIIASIVTSTGLVARYLLDHTHPGHCLEALEVRLGTPAYPGDRLRLVSQSLEQDADVETLRVLGTTAGGVHLDARAVVRSPAK